MFMEISTPESLAVMPENAQVRTTFWRQHVDSWRESSVSQREYARTQGLPIARFTYWKNKLYPNTQVQKKDFVPVRMGASSGGVRLTHPSGLIIECPVGTDTAWLHSLLGMPHAP
jgi:hypothetical protein